MEPAGEWLAGRIDDATLVTRASAAFERMIALWRGREPSPHRVVQEGAAA
jgi:5-dehydro-2-deoxygluconokinase